MRNKILTLGLVLCTSIIMAQDKPNLEAEANNPLASMTAFNIQNYYIPSFTNAPEDYHANTAWLRYAKPFAKGKLLLRASVPFHSRPVGRDNAGILETKSGMGDMNAFLAYNFVSDGGLSVGAGPLIQMPTGVNGMSAEKWDAGLALVAFNGKSPVFQYGGLVTWQASFAGEDTAPDHNILAFQPFMMLQIGKGFYLRNVPVATFDLENSAYNIPLGMGAGKVMKTDKIVYNFFVEPQYSIANKGAQPNPQIFVGLNFQFIQ